MLDFQRLALGDARPDTTAKHGVTRKTKCTFSLTPYNTRSTRQRALKHLARDTEVSPAVIAQFGWPAAFQIYGGAGATLALLWVTQKLPEAAPGEAPPEQVTFREKIAAVPWSEVPCRVRGVG